MKITITGQTATIVPAFNKATYDKVAKWMPKLLDVTEDKDVIFAVRGVKEGKGNINQYGAEFAPAVGGKLAVTLDLPAGLTVEEAKEFVYDKVGGAATYIEAIEKLIAENIEAIDTNETEFKDSITVQ